MDASTVKGTTVDGVDVLSRISGLPKKDIREIWKETQANHRRLQECAGPHDFQPLEEEGRRPRKYRCTHCGGEVSSINATWYKRGLTAGQSGR